MERVARAGAPLHRAPAAMVLVHGRGADAATMLDFAEMLAQDLPGAGEMAFLAPQAPDRTWYPQSFLAPLDQNEPYLTQALKTLGELFGELEQHGLPPEQTALLGFSQGACLSLEFSARSVLPFGSVIGLSGGLIGPPGALPNYPGRLDGVPVFLGCSDVDPHIPKQRVWETSRTLQQMGAQVITRIYPGMGHTVNEDEITVVRRMITTLLEKAASR